ncbi:MULTISPECIES: immunity 22 family protein [unclassified Bacillus (in: firmicutes)]|uniref:immunity 22 family protein n=1 Tax=unclassified Bacillus (in: firmicutes) TaxID=185979 RepID=UPI0028166FB8|nr:MULTISPECIES: immunity 22 family protein [unclassified Bacillus (in: firmicutes)]
MENIGVMSLWLGNLKSKEMLQKYVEIKFDEKEDRIPSQFMRDFHIDFVDYNEDLLEITFIDISTTSIQLLLDGASYYEKIISQFTDYYGEHMLERYNAVIRVYDVEYSEANAVENRNVVFAGAVVYEEWEE